MEGRGVVSIARSFSRVLAVLSVIAIGKALGKGAGQSPPREQESGCCDECERNWKLMTDAPCQRSRDELFRTYVRLVDYVEVITLRIGDVRTIATRCESR